ncbi:uncharacterized protein EAF02_009321 [Botrytis sinoallii]|uniref:uncharacterized protein n=1 Tax=Botrytis sinoallii TaxID=1463999 RepID=UPI0019019D3E|nr:uncharacterized protein EAF02_009321 [Botrytis sinoallii]KAF7870131.1 hypothetical protein EAF02_009321 [Botrytis sinoallii]
MGIESLPSQVPQNWRSAAVMSTTWLEVISSTTKHLIPNRLFFSGSDSLREPRARLRQLCRRPVKIIEKSPSFESYNERYYYVQSAHTRRDTPLDRKRASRNQNASLSGVEYFYESSHDSSSAARKKNWLATIAVETSHPSSMRLVNQEFEACIPEYLFKYVVMLSWSCA